MRQPVALDVVRSLAETNGVCVRPLAQRRLDYATGRVDIVPVACGSTVASVCAPCADKARKLRMAQCREGWHLDDEPDFTPAEPTSDQAALTELRSTLWADYQNARAQGDESGMEDLREAVTAVDVELREGGVRGKLPALDAPAAKPVKRSTRRKQDVPELPRRKVAKHTLGREFAGRFRPSMFLTLTLDSYGRVHDDGTPVNPDGYDYRRAARDAVHFAALLDRWVQNLRRAVGYDVQYFSTVEPQRRLAPHWHAALRGAIPHELVRLVTAGTYHQVWWPQHDELVYPGETVPVWCDRAKGFVDPATREALPTWEQALPGAEDSEPAHVVRFGAQVHSKGILGGTEESGRHIGYLTKYLTKSISECQEEKTERQRRHADRLHEELRVTPCSPRCAVWLLYGIQPAGARMNLVAGRCKGKAHRRSTLGLPGRRVLVSRKWSGKSLADHRHDRTQFVRQLLQDVGITPDTDRDNTGSVVWQKVAPGDPDVPPRAHLLMHAVAERLRWKAQYKTAQLAASGGDPPTPPDLSATGQAA
ncbi:replication initiator [Crossiella sp. S99.1]|uniref:replication initiator n=1 Tax=Crossiella sp. S99.1 TaxID=2936271 RepID=UPI001FFFE793|nr:replication initiator [Crossiella sp. S99.1]MCK2257053.1 replication initiator protein [Crossiella sp. S99.1]